MPKCKYRDRKYRDQPLTSIPLEVAIDHIEVGIRAIPHTQRYSTIRDLQFGHW